jgi:hypothetical protein
MEMTDIQLYVLSVLAMVIVAVVNGLAKAKVQIGRGWLTAGVYVVAGALAFAWSAPMFPMFPAWDSEMSIFVPAFFQWFSDVLMVVGPVVGLATLLYNALWAKVEEGVGRVRDSVDEFLGMTE